jgi:hypothetical protein
VRRSAAGDFGATAGSTATDTSPFNSSCPGALFSGQDAGKLTTTAQKIFANTGPVDNGFGTLIVMAAISAFPESHNDYTDTLFFVATGTF